MKDFTEAITLSVIASLLAIWLTIVAATCVAIAVLSVTGPIGIVIYWTYKMIMGL